MCVTNSDFYAYAHSYANCDSISVTDAYSYANPQRYANGHSDEHSNSYRETHTITAGSPDAASSPDSVAVRGKAAFILTTRSTLVDRLLLKTMAKESPKAQTKAKQAATLD